MEADKVIVTGAAGFIGRNLALALAEKLTPLVLVDHLDAFDRTSSRLPQAEILSPDDLLGKPAKYFEQIKVIYHIGAITDTTYEDEEQLARWNTQYSQSLWKKCQALGVGFVYASSAATYGDGSHGYADDVAVMPQLAPLNPYGWSKHLFDLWVLEQTKQRLEPKFWSGFKFFNVYGPFELHKKSMASVVTHAYHQIKATGQVKLFKSHKEGIADGQQKRDFIFVKDVVDVLLFAGSKPIESGIYNLGTGQARSFLDLAHAVFSALDSEKKIVFMDTPENLRARYQYFTQANMEKLRRQGYLKPFASLEDGVEQTIASFENRNIHLER